MLEKSNTWPEQVLDTLNSCWRALLESCSNTQANVRRDPLEGASCIDLIIHNIQIIRALDPPALHSDHFLACVLCPEQVKNPCKAMRAGTDQKRKEKEQHQELVVAEQQHALQVAARSKAIASGSHATPPTAVGLKV